MRTRNALTALLATFVLGLGCQAADDTPLETSARPVRAEPRGPGKLVIDTLDELQLSPEQRARVNAQVAKAQKVLEPVRLTQAGLMAEAAEQLRVGKVDDAKIKVLIGDLKEAFDNARPTIVTALNEVHATLDAAQRKELIAKLRERHRKLRAKRHGPDGEHHGFRGFHGPRGRHAGPGHHHRRLARLLGLTPDQRVKIRDAIEALRADKPKGVHPFRERLEAAVKAFESDTFDAAKLPFFDRPLHHSLQMLDKVLQTARAVLPMLTKEQRDKLADKIEEHADWVAPTE